MMIINESYLSMVPKMFQHMSLKPALMREALTNMKIHDSPSITTVTRNSIRVSFMNLLIATHESSDITVSFLPGQGVYRGIYSFILSTTLVQQLVTLVHPSSLPHPTVTHYPGFFILATTPCSNTLPWFLHPRYHTLQ